MLCKRGGHVQPLHKSAWVCLQASISDLARGAGEENQQKEHREGHLLMQVSRVLQRRLQLATSSSTHSFLSTASHSLTSVGPWTCLLPFP